MAKSGAYIRDVNSLEELDGRIVGSGEAIASIDAEVITHINNVRDTLEKQLDFIQGRLRDAEQRLNQAESALNACRSSQSSAAAMGMMCPTCAVEEHEVNEACREVERWRAREETGRQIVSECSREIEEYTGFGGGHSLVRDIYERQTPKASQLLRGCIEKLQDILSTEVVINDTEIENVIENQVSMDDKRFAAFRKCIRRSADNK